jgi:DNA polymerase III epsilon subunit family exonuclease
MELPSTFTAIDIETTGLGNWDRIIEISVVKCKGRKIQKKYHSLVYTDKKIAKEAGLIHGISQEMLIGQPQVWDVLKKVKSVAGDSVLIAHNASFDKRFILRAANGCRINISNSWIDTLQLARKFLPHMQSHKLERVAKELRLESGRYHRALDDAMMTAFIYMDFLEMADEEL